MEPSSSASFKRLRPTVSGSLRPSCLVDGCNADLSKCRDYHRRHKVCEVHSKTAVVTIRGHEQRFCQQCSRFHSLVEFDEGKRSCRKRLDGHNRRRRKPQPDSLSNLQGLRHIPFSIPQVFSTTSLSCSWLRAAKAETDLSSELELNFSNGNGFFRGSLPHSYKGEEPFTFLQTNDSSVVSGVSIRQPLLLDANPSSSDGSSSRKMFSNVLNQAIDSDRAHSLLSSHPAETGEIGLSSMVQSGPTSPLIPNLQYTGLAMQAEQVGTILSTDGSSNTDLHVHETFPTGRSGSLPATGTHQSLSFSWD